MRSFRPFHATAFAGTSSRLLSLSTYAVLGALCLTACTGEDDGNGGNGTGTGTGNKGGGAGTSGLNLGGSSNKGGSGGTAGTSGAAGVSGKGGAGGAAGKGGSAGKAGAAGKGGGAGKGGSAGNAQGGVGGEGGEGGEAGSGGAAGGSAGAAGFGGGNIVCATVADCPGPAATNECGGWVCETGLCFSAFAPKDKPASIQKPGDCTVQVCDGAGALVDRADPTDVRNDSNDCTKDVCTGQTPSNENLAAGDACGNGLTCDGAGNCTGCGKPSDCGAADACKTPTCTKGACGFDFAAAGTPLADGDATDCKRPVCDGNGLTIEVPSATDLPVDGTVCTQDVCLNGAPGHVPTGLGLPCENGGICNDAGKCVACLEPSTCPGQDTECERRTCDNNVCGVAFELYGTGVLNQTAGDCKKNICDGAGKVINVVDDVDVADDDNVCTKDACTTGTLSHTPVPAGESCGESLLCNGAGQCVGCVTGSDCAGTDDACKTRTCVNSVCGVSYAANGTPLADPVDGDCKTRVCDGAGNVVDAADGTDVRVDGNVCSRDICYNGNPANPASPAGTDCGGGKICSGTGACVECITAATCPGQDTECQTRTCVAGTCKLVFAPATTRLGTQINGDCSVDLCDGAGQIIPVADATDVRDDNKECTADTCGPNGPENTPITPGTPCGEGGICEVGGVCGGCQQPDDCPGTDSECRQRTCEQGVCGFFYQEDGTSLEGGQTSHDCKRLVCDGAGEVKSIADGEDVPVDDGIECTAEVCVGNAPAHPPRPAGDRCLRADESSGYCDGGTTCVACLVPAHCPGQDTFCSFPTCTGNVCGIGTQPANTVLPAPLQSTGDCQSLRCDSKGGIASFADDEDKPGDEGNQCTFDECAEGSPFHPSRPAGVPCTIGGTAAVCDGESSCVFCVEDKDCAGGKVCLQNECVTAGPVVLTATPANNTNDVSPYAKIVVTFNKAIAPASLTAASSGTACTGAIQLSKDDFATCVPFTSGLATPSVGNTVATLTPLGGLLANTKYRIRVTNEAKDEAGVPATPFAQPLGFTTGAPATLCDGDIVISQIYGAGGLTGAAFTHDFVELHNRGTTSVPIGGWSVQYASGSGSSWARVNLSDVVLAPGGFYLLQLTSGGGVGAALSPAADQTSTAIDLARAQGKVALVRDTTTLEGTCPTSNTSVVDFVGYGGTVNCQLGVKATAPAGNAQSLFRGAAGCNDARSNAEDFSLQGPPLPRSQASSAVACDCRAVNELGAPDEIDLCTFLAPIAAGPFTPGSGSGDYSGSVVASGVTSAAGDPVGLRVELGYGPVDDNPQYSSNWTWVDAGFDQGLAGDVDVFKASFIVPGPAPRTLAHTIRVSTDGRRFTFCDADGAGRGAATFDATKLGTTQVALQPR